MLQPFQYLCHVGVIAGDVVRAGISKTLIMARPEVAGGEQPDHRHPCGHARGHTERMILDHQAIQGIDAEPIGDVEIDVRVRLAPRHAGRAEYVAAEKARKPEPVEHHVEPGLLARRGDRQLPVDLAGKEALDTRDRGDLADTRFDRAIELRTERVGINPPPQIGLDQPVAVAPAVPAIALDGLLGTGRQAVAGEDLGQRRVRDDLAVDDDAVEIEDDGLESQPRSPNSAVPTRTWVAPTMTALS